MKKFVVPFAISAALWGCTDFSEELQPYEPLSIKSQSDLRDLPCSSKNEGEVVFITGGGNHWSLSYNCTGGVWIGQEYSDSVWYGVEYSSALGESSSSGDKVDVSSASVVPSSSASVKPSSSAFAMSSSSAVLPVTIADPVPKYNLGTCAPVDSVIQRGGSTSFKFTPNSPDESGYDIFAFVKADYVWDYGDGEADSTANMLTSAGVVYGTSGDKKVRVKVTMADGVSSTFTCAPLHVNGYPITGCSCSAKSSYVDVAAGGVAEWTVSGCLSADNELSFEWPYSMGTDSSATYTFTEGGEHLTPWVTVRNSDNSVVKVSCDRVNSLDSDSPVYIIQESGPAGAVALPKGQSAVIMNLPQDWKSGASFIMECRFDQGDNILTIDGETYQSGIVAFVTLPIEHSMNGYALSVELDTPATCYVAY